MMNNTLGWSARLDSAAATVWQVQTVHQRSNIETLSYPTCHVIHLVIQWYNESELLRERNHMIKKLSKHGNSLALVIDRSILDLLDIDEKTALDISTDGEALVVAPVRDKKRRKRFEDALKSTNEQFGRALKRLAE